VNATFDRRDLLARFRLFPKARRGQLPWLRVTAVGDTLHCASGPAEVSVPALVLEPGAFTTKRMPFASVLETYTTTDTLTIQADATRFRIGSFSAPALYYESAPKPP
jgi:hypothetical protein